MIVLETLITTTDVSKLIAWLYTDGHTPQYQLIMMKNLCLDVHSLIKVLIRGFLRMGIRLNANGLMRSDLQVYVWIQFEGITTELLLYWSSMTRD